jgi:hypothetical protein
LASVILGDLVTLFTGALATAGFDRDIDILHGLRFNFEALSRSYAAATAAAHADGTAEDSDRPADAATA